MIKCIISLCLIAHLIQEEAFGEEYVPRSNPTDMPLESRDLIKNDEKMRSYLQTLNSIKLLPGESGQGSQHMADLLVDNERLHIPYNRKGLDQVGKMQIDREKLQRYLDILDMESATKPTILELNPSRVMNYVKMLNEVPKASARPNNGLVYKSRIKLMKGSAPAIGYNIGDGSLEMVDDNLDDTEELRKERSIQSEDAKMDNKTGKQRAGESEKHSEGETVETKSYEEEEIQSNDERDPEYEGEEEQYDYDNEDDGNEKIKENYRNEESEYDGVETAEEVPTNENNFNEQGKPRISRNSISQFNQNFVKVIPLYKESVQFPGVNQSPNGKSLKQHIPYEQSTPQIIQNPVMQTIGFNECKETITPAPLDYKTCIPPSLSIGNDIPPNTAKLQPAQNLPVRLQEAEPATPPPPQHQVLVGTNEVIGSPGQEMVNQTGDVRTEDSLHHQVLSNIIGVIGANTAYPSATQYFAVPEIKQMPYSVNLVVKTSNYNDVNQNDPVTQQELNSNPNHMSPNPNIQNILSDPVSKKVNIPLNTTGDSVNSENPLPVAVLAQQTFTQVQVEQRNQQGIVAPNSNAPVNILPGLPTWEEAFNSGNERNATNPNPSDQLSVSQPINSPSLNNIQFQKECKNMPGATKDGQPTNDNQPYVNKVPMDNAVYQPIYPTVRPVTENVNNAENPYVHIEKNAPEFIQKNNLTNNSHDKITPIYNGRTQMNALDSGTILAQNQTSHKSEGNPYSEEISGYSLNSGAQMFNSSVKNRECSQSPNNNNSTNPIIPAVENAKCNIMSQVSESPVSKEVNSNIFSQDCKEKVNTVVSDKVHVQVNDTFNNEFKVTNNTNLANDRQFLINLQIRKNLQADSGDALRANEPCLINLEHEIYPLQPVDEITDINSLKYLVDNLKNNSHEKIGFFRPTKPPFMYDGYYDFVIQKLKNAKQQDRIARIEGTDEKEILNVLGKNLAHIHLDRSALIKIIGKALGGERERRDELAPNWLGRRNEEFEKSSHRGQCRVQQKLQPDEISIQKPIYPKAMAKWKEKNLFEDKRSLENMAPVDNYRNKRKRTVSYPGNDQYANVLFNGGE